jgi:hypothetical protein
VVELDSLAAEAAVGAVVVVVVLPFVELVVEDLGVVDEGAVEEPVELLGVDAVRAFDAPMFVKPAGQAAASEVAAACGRGRLA